MGCKKMGLFGSKSSSATAAKPKKQLKEKSLSAQSAAMSTAKPKKKTKAEKQKETILKYVQDTIPYESVYEDGIFVN